MAAVTAAAASAAGRRMRTRIPNILSRPCVCKQVNVAVTNEASGTCVPPTCISTHYLSSLVHLPPGRVGIVTASFSTDAISASSNDDENDALFRQLEADTDAALKSGQECEFSALLDRWLRLHEDLLGCLTRAEWSDPTRPKKLQEVVRCAERVDELVRSYHAGGVSLSSSFAGGQEDKLEPYRLAIVIWGKTPTTFSGDRAAAILELWGDKYGGDMTEQPTIDAFDAVLKAYALSADVHVPDAASDEFEETPMEYPDDKAVSTLRLLRNLGDMYLAPTVSTVSYVTQALRRASRTPRCRNDGRNAERARTVTTLIREMEKEAASLFEDDRDDFTDEEENHQDRYIQACCDAFTMSIKNLPIDEAIEESRYFLDEIDKRAFGYGSQLISSLASRKRTNVPDMARTTHLIQNTCAFALGAYRDRATTDDVLAVIPKPHEADDFRHISTLAMESVDLVTRMKRWDGVAASHHYASLEKICNLTTRPSIIYDEHVDVADGVVPLLLQCEELLLGAKDTNVERNTGFQYLMSSWAALSGVVEQIPGPDGSFTSPADRAENLLMVKFERNLLCDPDQRFDLTYSYNAVLSAWAKARAGKSGAKKALDLFEEMQSNRVYATPDDVTYGLVLRCLRYGKSPSMAEKAESIIAHMHKGFECGAEDSVRPTARHYGAAIAAMAKSGHRDAASMSKSLLKRLLVSYYESKEDELLPDNYMFCEVIYAIGRDKGDSHRALKIKNLMRNLTDLYEDTGHERLALNEAVFGTAISAIANIRDGGEDALEVMESILDQMRQHNIRPNERLLTILINCYGNFQLPEAAESVLREMEAIYMGSGKEKFRPTTEAYNAAILAFAKVGNAERCQALLDEMLDKYSRGDNAVKPSPETFEYVINALWKSRGANVPEEATYLLQLMEDKYAAGEMDLAPTAAAYTSAINAMARSDLPDKAVRAKEFLQRAKRQVESGNVCAKLDASLYTAVLNACAFTKGSHDDRATALAIAQEVEAELHASPSLCWDSIAFNTLIQVYGYLVRDESERTRLSAGLFKRCCEKGLVSKQLLATLRRFAPTVYSELEDKSKKGKVIFGNLPAEWSRNTRNTRRRR